MKYTLNLLFLFMSYQLGAMQKQEVIGGPNKGAEVFVQESKDTANVLKNIMCPSEMNYFAGLSYAIKIDNYQSAFSNAVKGDSVALMKILKKHGYDGTVHYTEINGIVTCIHHTWLKKKK